MGEEGEGVSYMRRKEPTLSSLCQPKSRTKQDQIRRSENDKKVFPENSNPTPRELGPISTINPNDQDDEEDAERECLYA